ncbi:pyrroline-5-carboxylate reductase [Desulfonema magnum]|uniref:Pyrroline-5-carboxylate reductase n=1 Tax=Desulfonema magnum TaxID=45655 RepID=A0A975BWW7_9BACT|nr:pyrroline-5-carboxylate reductase [Desulfonema magnum]QTA92604.1 Pyrroline-5-carboxylate reductase [Desulfonema magnum]
MAELNKKIGFIGSGNMGEAFVGALIQSGIFSPSTIYVSDISEERLNMMRGTYGIHTMNNNVRLFSECDIVVLAIKPQQMNQILSQISGQEGYGISDRKLVISIAAGIPIRKIEALLYSPLDDGSRQKLPIIRVMPNTPALVLSGMSGMSANAYVTADEVTMTKTILEAMGKVVEFKEEELDAVTGLSGSGPAYVFYLAESMTQAGINVGLDPNDAAVLTLATLEGAVQLMKARDESPEELRRKVTSPGGTTEAALKVMEENKVRQNIIDAIAAATRRSKELSQ